MSDRQRCKEYVPVAGLWHAYKQCARYNWKDGYCRQHHPDTVKARRDAAEDRWSYRRNKDQVVMASKKITTLTNRIAETEAALQAFVDSPAAQKFLPTRCRQAEAVLAKWREEK